MEGRLTLDRVFDVIIDRLVPESTEVDTNWFLNEYKTYTESFVQL